MSNNAFRPIIKTMTDDRGVILNWLAKLVLALLIGGVIIYDAGSIAVNFFGLSDAADSVANGLTQEVSVGGLTEAELPRLQSCKKNPAVSPGCETLNDLLVDHDVKLVKIRVDEQDILKVKLRRTAGTLVVGRIGAIEDWATATAQGESPIHNP